VQAIETPDDQPYARRHSVAVGASLYRADLSAANLAANLDEANLSEADLKCRSM
jgi:hypothetical protein